MRWNYRISAWWWRDRELKLGKKEDEFVVLSDAELDSKLELFEAIGKSSTDLLRIIEMYQEKYNYLENIVYDN